MTLPVVFTANGPSGYNLTKSLRFRSSASAYLNRTATTPTNGQKFTLSFWLKRGTLTTSSAQWFFTGGATSNVSLIGFPANSDTLAVYQTDSVGQGQVTSAVLRDPSAWYSIIIAVDTTQASNTNRIKIYINNVQQATSVSGTVTQNSTWGLNSANVLNIGRYGSGVNSNYLDGYLAEVNFIDGQALTPSSFGSTNALTGVWQPAKYTGTYGTNGFYLPFTDNSATTPVGLGKDFSGNAGTAIVGTTTSGSNSMTVVSLTGISVGNTVTGPGIPTGTYVTAASVLTVTLSQNATSSNVSQSYTFAGNNWFCNNISLTAGTTYDSMTDVPTLTSTTTANYCVLNPLDKNTSITASNGNLTATTPSGFALIRSTMFLPSGKYYWEVTCTTTGNGFVGISSASESLSSRGAETANSATISTANGNLRTSGSDSAYGSAISNGNVMMFALDMTSGKFWAGKSGTWFASGDPAAGTNAGKTGLTVAVSPSISLYDNENYSANFGQQGFTYTPPTGFVALNTYNLPTSTIVKGNTVMDATLWSGNGSTQTITNAASFKPDFVWVKDRNTARGSMLFDSVRGIYNRLRSNTTDAEQTETDTLTAFNSSGFNLSTNIAVNGSGETYVGWQWQAGQGTTLSNTNGSITSTVSVNASAGFSVVTYASTTGTVGHGLGVAPTFIIMKGRNVSDQWTVGANSLGWNCGLPLNTTATLQTNSGFWNNTAPTSSVFSQGSWDSGYNKVAYCFTPIAGYSAFGYYGGNLNANGPFVYTGFRPRFILIKSIDGVGNWTIVDTARDPYNYTTAGLYPNLSNAESNSGAIDILSNGFKIRSTFTDLNDSGISYIYMAFAENPFKNALAR